MDPKSDQNRKQNGAKTREDRLKTALKANLQRRKAQARARDDGQTVSDKSSEKS